MQVVELQEGLALARRKYAEYAAAVKRYHGNEQYEVLKRAYREISLKRRVIHLANSIEAGGDDELGRPRLAVVRADYQYCYLDRGTTHLKFRGGTKRAIDYRTDRRTEFAQRLNVSSGVRQWRAIVPAIPPGLMPRGQLRRYYILWEADWERVPVDPMLLRPLGGQLYVVLATWDLTPLERAVLGDSLNSGR